MNQQSNETKERLIRFSIQISGIVDLLPRNRLGTYISGQLIRSGFSPAFNYGEVQFAESDNDFIHKLKVCLKELNEVDISLKVIQYKPLLNDISPATAASIECNELIAILVASVNTKRKNMKSGN